MLIVRVTGGLRETLVHHGGATIATMRGQAVEVPDAIAKDLLKDGTGRFTVPDASATAAPAPSVDAEDLPGGAP